MKHTINDIGEIKYSIQEQRTDARGLPLREVEYNLLIENFNDRGVLLDSCLVPESRAKTLTKTYEALVARLEEQGKISRSNRR